MSARHVGGSWIILILQISDVRILIVKNLKIAIVVMYLLEVLLLKLYAMSVKNLIVSIVKRKILQLLNPIANQYGIIAKIVKQTRIQRVWIFGWNPN